MTVEAKRRTLVGAGLGLAGSALCARGMIVAAGGILALSATPLAAAQAPGKVYRIGCLMINPRDSLVHLLEVFRQGLRDHGYHEGGNVMIEYRFAEGRAERLPELAAEIARLQVDLIVTSPTASAVAAHKATRSIPIVAVSVADPVSLGLAASLARPGGNLTGLSYSVELDSITKGLQLLKEAVPGAQRVAVLSNPANPLQPAAVDNLAKAARPLGLQLQLLEARRPEDFDAVFAAMVRERAAALFVAPDSLFMGQRVRLAEMALKHRLPSMYGLLESVEAGGLLGYGPSLRAQYRRAATYVHKILQGAPPGELPIEQPTKYELVVNLKTARALDLAIPAAILQRADRVIE